MSSQPGSITSYIRGKQTQVPVNNPMGGEIGNAGEFKRVASTFREKISQDGKFQPEGGRYHLYISLGCPWACRALIYVYLKGLEDQIGLSVVHPTWQQTRPGQDDHYGWTFANPSDPPFKNSNGYGSFPPIDVIPDTINNAKYIRDLYEMSDPSFNGRYTVPVLWDKKTKSIVNNESSDIIRQLNTEFNNIAKHPKVDMYPENLRSKIDEVNEWVYPQLNNGVYRGGFATGQDAYEAAFKDVFQGLDKCEKILSHSRYIAGDQLTEADVRLYVTLIRFDPVYVVYFKHNKKFINQYPNVREYVKELYSIPAFQRSTNFYHIKTHYFSSHANLNPYGVVPIGTDPWWNEKSDRIK